jgi:HEPN domain-containing protein
MKAKTESWFNFARADYKSAKKLLNDNELARIVTFHCQQTVEKSLKAILEEYDIIIPKTHSLIKLFSLVPDEIKTIIDVNEDELIPIDKIYIDSRYPVDTGLFPYGSPDIEDARMIFNAAENIFNKILSAFKK